MDTKGLMFIDGMMAADLHHGKAGKSEFRELSNLSRRHLKLQFHLSGHRLSGIQILTSLQSSLVYL
jgi:hypothetical protein